MADTKTKIEEQIKSKPVFMYMKGNPDFPQCGFSAQTVQVLKHAGVSEEELGHFDVLTDPEIRQGIKDFTQWPTIPQVFVRGKFIGGCDIVTEMYQKGELQGLLKG